MRSNKRVKQIETDLFRYRLMYEKSLWATHVKSSCRRYTTILDKWFRMFPERNHPDEVSRFDAREYIERRKKQKATRGGLSWEIQILRAFWNWMIEHGYGNYNPFSKHKWALPEPTEVRALDPDAIEAMYEACQDDVERRTFLLVLNTGLYPTALKTLRRSDIDFEAGVLKANGAVIPLREDLLLLLKDAPNQLVPKGIRHFVPRLGMRAGYLGITYSRVRATLASTLFRSGVDPRTVAQLLGLKTLREVQRFRGPDAPVQAALASLIQSPSVTLQVPSMQP